MQVTSHPRAVVPTALLPVFTAPNPFLKDNYSALDKKKPQTKTKNTSKCFSQTSSNISSFSTGPHFPAEGKHKVKVRNSFT